MTSAAKKPKVAIPGMLLIPAERNPIIVVPRGRTKLAKKRMPIKCNYQIVFKVFKYEM